MPRSRKGDSVWSNSTLAYTETMSTQNSAGIIQLLEDESSLISVKELIILALSKVGENLKAVIQYIQKNDSCLPAIETRLVTTEKWYLQMHEELTVLRGTAKAIEGQVNKNGKIFRFTGGRF